MLSKSRNSQMVLVRCAIYCALIPVLLLQSVLAAEKKTGGIQGKINFCGKGGVLGMQVFIAGRDHVVYTDHSGQFLFELVNAGTYTLYYSHRDEVVNSNREIRVNAGQVTELGEIAFCREISGLPLASAATVAAPGANSTDAAAKAATDCQQNPIPSACLDQDNDGIVAALDCNDQDPKTRPGALELCDGVDNNCNGAVDDVERINISHGLGSCQKGSVKLLSCERGFGDCDANIENGCETDLMRDQDNCGVCGNACSLEICALGSC